MRKKQKKNRKSDLFFLFRLKISEQRRKELYAKQGRGNQFRNREERDTWIKNELKTLHRGIRDKETQITNLKEDIDVTKIKQQELEETISVSENWPRIYILIDVKICFC